VFFVTQTPDNTLGQTSINPECQRVTIHQIFSENHNWDVYKFKHSDELREVEVREVEKMLQCQDDSRGYFLYRCSNCGDVKVIHFGCNSRVCTHCGKKYTDKWAKQLAERTFDIAHRHVVLTIPEQLRLVFQKQRKLLKILMDSSIGAISTLMRWQLGRDVTPGIVAVLHTYGNDLKFNSHVHALVTEGGFTSDGKWRSMTSYWYKIIRRTWQYNLLTNLKKAMDETKENQELIDFLFKQYPNGFYVRAKDRIEKKDELIRYIGRYIRHPAVAECRITGYDGKSVTFYYDEKNKKGEVIRRHYVTKTVDEFISAIIGHIPDSQFKTIRYYGVYHRPKRRHFRELLSGFVGLVSITQEKLLKWTEKWTPKCERCDCKMEVVWYGKGPPPENLQFGERIVDWQHICSASAI